LKRIGVFVAVAAAVLTTAVSPAAAAAKAAPLIKWGSCRTYTDQELKGQLHGHQLADFKRQVARRQCGTLSVPLDYGYPTGRQLSIAVTRFPATGRRAGALAVNPGGPGDSGVLLPADVSLGAAKGLADRFDLIGFDPRGVGDSTRLACAEIPPPTFSVDREVNRKMSTEFARVNRECAASDRALTGSLSTANIARDMDRIRAALGEKKLSYLGISWGTALGAAYQTLYPQRVKHMVLDSVLLPDTKLDRFTVDQAVANEHDAQRFVAELPKLRPELGRTPAEVTATIDRIRTFFTANPQDKVPGVDEFVDQFTLAFTLAQNSLEWPTAAGNLVAMKNFVDANGTSVSALTAGKKHRTAPPVEFFTGPVNVAVQCNADLGNRDFDRWFDQYEGLVKRLPLTGLTSPTVPFCIGWPAATSPDRFARTGASVLLVGHRFEFVTPIEWLGEMKARIGGRTLVVEDDVHGALIDVPQAADAVNFLLS
jgi:pimeloyl-ACP methyl ester carboxylesterase